MIVQSAEPLYSLFLQQKGEKNTYDLMST